LSEKITKLKIDQNHNILSFINAIWDIGASFMGNIVGILYR